MAGLNLRRICSMIRNWFCQRCSVTRNYSPHHSPCFYPVRCVMGLPANTRSSFISTRRWPVSKIIDALPLPPAYYHASETSYWRRDGKNTWIKINETSTKSFIADYGYSKTAAFGGSNSEVDRAL